MRVRHEMDAQERNNDIKSMTVEELQSVLSAYGEKAYRAGQLFSWLHEAAVTDYDAMTSLPASLRARLKEDYPLTVLTPVTVQISRIDGTRKYLFALPDGILVESVFMKYRFGNSVCISSQAGCRMGCRFCASTLDGVIRSLLASEMLEQVYAIGRELNETVSRVVVMGMGEPLENLANVERFIALLTHEKGRHLSARAITISTCGLVPEIYELASRHYRINLAISLHAPTQEKRSALMPVANRYPLDMLLAACRDYYEKTHRQLTFEYALIAGANDTVEDAHALAKLLKEFNCIVNLIPVNPVKETGMQPTNKTDVLKFRQILEKNGIHVTIRREMGRDIDGACGQLRRRKA